MALKVQNDFVIKKPFKGFRLKILSNHANCGRFHFIVHFELFFKCCHDFSISIRTNSSKVSVHSIQNVPVSKSTALIFRSSTQVLNLEFFVSVG